MLMHVDEARDNDGAWRIDDFVKVTRSRTSLGRTDSGYFCTLDSHKAIRINAPPRINRDNHTVPD
jgi:hypothetical protein